MHRNFFFFFPIPNNSVHFRCLCCGKDKTINSLWFSPHSFLPFSFQSEKMWQFNCAFKFKSEPLYCICWFNSQQREREFEVHSFTRAGEVKKNNLTQIHLINEEWKRWLLTTSFLCNNSTHTDLKLTNISSTSIPLRSSCLIVTSRPSLAASNQFAVVTNKNGDVWSKQSPSFWKSDSKFSNKKKKKKKTPTPLSSFVMNSFLIAFIITSTPRIWVFDCSRSQLKFEGAKKQYRTAQNREKEYRKRIRYVRRTRINK